MTEWLIWTDLNEDQPPIHNPLCSQGPAGTTSRRPSEEERFHPRYRPEMSSACPSPPPAPSSFGLVSGPCTGLSHGGSVVLAMLRCLLTTSKWTSSVIIFCFLAALSLFLGNSFFVFSMDRGDLGGRENTHTLHVTWKTYTHQAITDRLWNWKLRHGHLFFVGWLQTGQQQTLIKSLTHAYLAFYWLLWCLAAQLSLPA